MNLPGIITIHPNQTDLIKRASEVTARSFLEEPWFELWISSLDKINATDERKYEILEAGFRGEFTVHAPLQGVYATEDFAAVAGAFLSSEFGDVQHADLEDEGFEMFLPELLTDEEMEILGTESLRLDPVSDFKWFTEHAQGKDYIYFYSWAVDVDKRGTGALRRLLNPFFDYADEHGIDCYLECYSDRLQSMYEHIGFEVIDVVAEDGIEISERCMIRRAGASRSN